METRRKLTATALSGFSVILAHHFTYRLVLQDHHAREHLLSETGHSWLALAPFFTGSFLALAAAIAAQSKRVSPLRWLIGPLSAASYVLIEVSERVLSGSHHGVIHAPTLVTGALLACAFGLASALILRKVESVIVAMRQRPSFQRRSVASWSVKNAFCPLSVHLSAAHGRAPPVFN